MCHPCLSDGLVYQVLGLELKKHAVLVLEQKKVVVFQLTFWCAVTFTCRWSGSPALAVRRHFCSVKKATLKSGSGSTFRKTCRAACSHFFCGSSLQSSSGTSTPRASPFELLQWSRRNILQVQFCGIRSAPLQSAIFTKNHDKMAMNNNNNKSL